MKKIVFIILSLLFICLSSFAQDVTGTWKTIDDHTNEARSYVTLNLDTEGELQGQITKLLKASSERKCQACIGDRKDKPVLNMFILEDMKLKDGFFQGGKILDPDNGKWYSCKMWLKEGDPNVLVVRGYIALFYRTQYWYRVQ